MVKFDRFVSQTRPMNLGVTHTHASIPSAGKGILSEVPSLQNHHVMGWGADNPLPSPGAYRWASLDSRLGFIKSTGGKTILTACAAPDWIKGDPAGTTNWSTIEKAPIAARYQDYANLIADTVRRYPQIEYVQVWNEMKGFWNNSKNRWNYEGYTDLYNRVYRAVKAVRPSVKVGGPYPSTNIYKSSNAAGYAHPTLKGPWGTADRRDTDTIVYWLKNMVGADFVCLDGWTTTREGGLNTDAVTACQRYRDYTKWINTLTDLPVWWSEFYPINEHNAPAGSAEAAAIYLAGVAAVLEGGGANILMWSGTGAENVGGIYNSSGRTALTNSHQWLERRLPKGNLKLGRSNDGLIGFIDRDETLVVNPTSKTVQGINAYSTKLETTTGGSVPTDAENIAVARKAVCGADTGYPYTIWNRMHAVCVSLIEALQYAGKTIPAPRNGAADGGPWWVVEKKSDDVAQQLTARWPAFGTNLNTDELSAYADLLGDALIAQTPVEPEPEPPVNPTSPTTPNGFTATVNQTDKTVLLRWEGVAAATSYRIYESVMSAGQVVDEVQALESRRGPLANGQYKYSVSAVNSAGESVKSPEVTVQVGTTTPTPPPPGPTSPIPASATLLKVKDFSTGDLSQFANLQTKDRNGAPGSYSTYSASVRNGGPGHETAARFEVRDGDIPSFGGGERSEVRASDLNVQAGQKTWYEWSSRLGDAGGSFPATTSWGLIIMQWHSNEGSPPLAIHADGGQISLENDRSGGYRRAVCPIDAGVWHDYVLFVEWGTNGLMEMWRDGVKLVSFRAANVVGTEQNYLKAGIYRSADHTNTHVAWLDNLRVYAG